MRPAVVKLFHSRTGSAQFARYAIIGSAVFCIDIGTFIGLLRAHVLLPVAVTLAYVTGVTVHFTVNKYWNFRIFSRSIANQARTFLVVAAAQLFTTLVIVEACVHVAKLPPLESRILAVAVNIPLSFLAHKYLTFGAGIRDALKGIVR